MNKSACSRLDSHHTNARLNLAANYSRHWDTPHIHQCIAAHYFRNNFRQRCHWARIATGRQFRTGLGRDHYNIHFQAYFRDKPPAESKASEFQNWRTELYHSASAYSHNLIGDFAVAAAVVFAGNSGFKNYYSMLVDSN
ncbi:MAG: hypothetical protein GY820_42640 [Gammaproteobacteria bacterium]|nr:hypothetical protein [Gammaproteobacteria bacterium]